MHIPMRHMFVHFPTTRVEAPRSRSAPPVAATLENGRGVEQRAGCESEQRKMPVTAGGDPPMYMHTVPTGGGVAAGPTEAGSAASDDAIIGQLLDRIRDEAVTDACDAQEDGDLARDGDHERASCCIAAASGPGVSALAQAPTGGFIIAGTDTRSPAGYRRRDGDFHDEIIGSFLVNLNEAASEHWAEMTGEATPSAAEGEQAGSIGTAPPAASAVVDELPRQVSEVGTAVSPTDNFKATTLDHMKKTMNDAIVGNIGHFDIAPPRPNRWRRSSAAAKRTLGSEEQLVLEDDVEQGHQPHPYRAAAAAASLRQMPPMLDPRCPETSPRDSSLPA